METRLTSMKTLMDRYGEWFYRGFVLVALAGMWIGRYEGSAKAMQEMAFSVESTRAMVQEIRTSVAVVVRQQEVNTDRIKVMEGTLSTHLSKMP